MAGCGADGDPHALDGNQILSNAGDGVENRGTGTTLTGNTILKNRRDITNDVAGGATITIADDNVFATGGADVAPDV